MLGSLATRIAALVRTKRGAMCVAAVLGCVLVGSLIIREEDRQKQDELLRQDEVLAQTLDVAQIQALTGSAADLTAHAYQRLQRQLAAVQACQPNCQRVYLAGCRPSGDLFVYVDSAPQHSSWFMRPGEPYDGANNALRAAFHTPRFGVVAATTGRRGACFSLLTPVRNPLTGEALAVLGMDLDAAAWYRDLVLRTALPLGALLGIVSVLLIFAVAAFRKPPVPRPLLRRVFPVLIAVLVLLVLGFVAISLYMYRQQDRRQDQLRAAAIARDFRQAVAQQSLQLLTVLQPVLADPRLAEGLGRGNAEELLQTWRPVYKALHYEKQITHFCFLATNHVCLLRVHAPDKRGDVINSFTVREAERTQVAASGLELWPLGTLSVRAVQPVIRNGELLGYVEVGREISGLLQGLCSVWPDDQVAILVRKDLLNRQAWETSTRLLGRQPEWERFARHVLVYCSRGDLPAAVATAVERAASGSAATAEKVLDVAAGGGEWDAAMSPLLDVSGQEIGSLVNIHDAVKEAAGFRQILLLAVGVSTLLLSIVLGLIAVLLRRADSSVLQQQANLQREKDKLTAIFRSAPVGILLLDETAAVVETNQTAQNMFARCTRDVVNQQPGAGLNCIHSHEHVKGCGFAEACATCRLRGAITQTLITGESMHSVETDFTCTGETEARKYWLLISTDAILVGGQRHILVSLTDITDRKQTEDALRASNSFANALMESIPLPIFFKNKEGRYTRFNKAFEEFFGKTRDQLLDKTVYDIASPELAEIYFSKDMELLWNKGTQTYEAQMKDARGELHEVLYHKATFEDADGEILGLIGAVVDITERKRMETALQASRQRYQQLFDSAADAIMTLEPPDWRFTSGNPATLKLFGAESEAAFVALGPWHLSPERQPDGSLSVDKAPEMIALAMRNGSNLFEWTHQNLNGYPFQAIVRLSRMEMDGRVFLQATVRDETVRKEVEQALQEANRKLEEATAQATAMAARAELASAAKSTFLASMSHEIRTPLNGVIGMTRLLLGTAMSAEQQRYADIVKNSAESLLLLLNDILDYSKMEAGKLHFEQLDFDLEETLEEVTASLALRAYEKGLDFLCSMDPQVPLQLVGDPVRLRQIVNNLVGNALKFTHQGEVVIRVTCEAQTEADVTLRVSVRDTGIGIPADKQDLLFQQFSQVDASTTRKYGGTGLGLAISRQLVEMMGGSIHVSSAEGRGSDFWFVLRLPRQAASAGAHQAEHCSLSGIPLLIVDDHAASRAHLADWATSWGMRPVVAADGPAALEILQQSLAAGKPIQCVIMDLQLAGMNGSMLGAAIRLKPAYKQTKLLVTTALGSVGETRMFDGGSFDACLMKPLRRRETRGILEKVLGVAVDRSEVVPETTPGGAADGLRALANRSGRILLAEDNQTNQQVAVGILRMLGLTADTVMNGQEALQALEKQDYDLVLMDCLMPEMDGLEATCRIRDPKSAVRNHQIPIIAMTANAMAGDRQDCLAVGMNGYVAKPVDPALLAKELDKWLPKTEDGGRRTEDRPTVRRSDSLTVPPSDCPIWDRAGMLERMMGNEELAQTILAGFAEDLPRRIEALREMLLSGNAKDATLQAHTIKGASATVGGEAVRAIAAALEEAGRKGDLQGMRSRLAEIEAGAAELLLAIGGGLG